MLMQGYEQLRQAHAIEHWPTTVGTILAVDMQAVDRRRRPALAAAGHLFLHSQRPRNHRHPHHAGQGPQHQGRDRGARLRRRLSAADAGEVHYNPVEITESVLEPATPRSAYLNLALGAGLACLGPALFMLVGMPASRRRGWLFWRRP